MIDATLPFAEKKFIEINGHRMAYIDEGEGAPIVFQHRNPTSSYLWRNVMPACPCLGHLIACDLTGMRDSAVMREPTDTEMAHYRKPFVNAGEDRRPTLTWPRQIPIEGEPADVVKIVSEYSQWLAHSQVPKLYFHTEPGWLDNGRQREFCRTWPNQKEVTVKGIHFVQEDSAAEVGAAVANFVRALRRESPQ